MHSRSSCMVWKLLYSYLRSKYYRYAMIVHICTFTSYGKETAVKKNIADAPGFYLH